MPRVIDCISQVSRASEDLPHKVQQSGDPSQENPGQASGDRLYFPGSTRKSQVTKPEASDLEGYYWMPQRVKHHAASSSGRNESTIPMRKHRETDCSQLMMT